MVTISSFREALSAPQSGFRTMFRLRWVDEQIRRSTYFAEAEVECGAERYLIYMPLASSSLRRVERVIRLHRHLLTPYVPRLELLRAEMCYRDSMGRETVGDILREQLPCGEPFADALAAVANQADAHRLVVALNELQGALLCADISHNAVRKENIIITTQGEARLIRWYYATEGIGGDDESFEALRSEILSQADLSLREPDKAYYNVETTFDNHLFVRPMHEGLAAVEDATGWGFVDSANKIVIAPIFDWVGDFYEGRAEVETESGMGVIDREGKFILPPRFESVEYDYHSGNTRAWSGSKCLYFDYDGHQIRSEEYAAKIDEVQMQPIEM